MTSFRALTLLLIVSIQPFVSSESTEFIKWTPNSTLFQQATNYWPQPKVPIVSRLLPNVVVQPMAYDFRRFFHSYDRFENNTIKFVRNAESDDLMLASLFRANSNSMYELSNLSLVNPKNNQQQQSAMCADFLQLTNRFHQPSEWWNIADYSTRKKCPNLCELAIIIDDRMIPSSNWSPLIDFVVYNIDRINDYFSAANSPGHSECIRLEILSIVIHNSTLNNFLNLQTINGLFKFYRLIDAIPEKYCLGLYLTSQSLADLVQQYDFTKASPNVDGTPIQTLLCHQSRNNLFHHGFDKYCGFLLPSQGGLLQTFANAISFGETHCKTIPHSISKRHQTSSPIPRCKLRKIVQIIKEVSMTTNCLEPKIQETNLSSPTTPFNTNESTLDQVLENDFTSSEIENRSEPNAEYSSNTTIYFEPKIATESVVSRFTPYESHNLLLGTLEQSLNGADYHLKKIVKTTTATTTATMANIPENLRNLNLDFSAKPFKQFKPQTSFITKFENPTKDSTATDRTEDQTDGGGNVEDHTEDDNSKQHTEKELIEVRTDGGGHVEDRTKDDLTKEHADGGGHVEVRTEDDNSKHHNEKELTEVRTDGGGHVENRTEDDNSKQHTEKEHTEVRTEVDLTKEHPEDDLTNNRAKDDRTKDNRIKVRTDVDRNKDAGLSKTKSQINQNDIFKFTENFLKIPTETNELVSQIPSTVSSIDLFAFSETPTIPTQTTTNYIEEESNIEESPIFGPSQSNIPSISTIPDYISANWNFTENYTDKFIDSITNPYFPFLLVHSATLNPDITRSNKNYFAHLDWRDHFNNSNPFDNRIFKNDSIGYSNNESNLNTSRLLKLWRSIVERSRRISTENLKADSDTTITTIHSMSDKPENITESNKVLSKSTEYSQDLAISNDNGVLFENVVSSNKSDSFENLDQIQLQKSDKTTIEKLKANTNTRVQSIFNFKPKNITKSSNISIVNATTIANQTNLSNKTNNAARKNLEPSPSHQKSTNFNKVSNEPIHSYSNWWWWWWLLLIIIDCSILYKLAYDYRYVHNVDLYHRFSN